MNARSGPTYEADRDPEMWYETSIPSSEVVGLSPLGISPSAMTKVRIRSTFAIS